MYTLFGFMAGYSGYLIWRVFLGVDSYEFPCRNYGDLGLRTWGENISAVSKFRLCYIVCPLLFIIAGFFITQIRTLKNYGWVANLAIWLNLLVIFITMGVIANTPPNCRC
jgi:hypothetical protein